jgi:hypothetical protein
VDFQGPDFYNNKTELGAKSSPRFAVKSSAAGWANLQVGDQSMAGWNNSRLGKWDLGATVTAQHSTAITNYMIPRAI